MICLALSRHTFQSPSSIRFFSRRIFAGRISTSPRVFQNYPPQISTEISNAVAKFVQKNAANSSRTTWKSGKTRNGNGKVEVSWIKNHWEEKLEQIKERRFFQLTWKFWDVEKKNWGSSRGIATLKFSEWIARKGSRRFPLPLFVFSRSRSRFFFFSFSLFCPRSFAYAPPANSDWSTPFYSAAALSISHLVFRSEFSITHPEKALRYKINGNFASLPDENWDFGRWKTRKKTPKK